MTSGLSGRERGRVNLADRRTRVHDPESFLFNWSRQRPPHPDETLFPAEWWDRLQGHPQLEEWIAELRESETAARKFRLRLEALRDQPQVEPERRCAYCGTPLYARAGAKYCSSVCRASASRSRRTPKE